MEHILFFGLFKTRPCCYMCNMGQIVIPNQWEARPYQYGFWDAIAQNKYRRAVAVWHRRAGKDSCAINLTAVKAVTEPGLYYYMAPTQKHARRIIWDNIGADGRRIITQAFPEGIRKSVNDQEMRIVMDSADGKESIFQVVGSDNYDSIVGSNPRGIVFSEWSIAAKPEAWEYFRPILAENKGWSAFIYTPRGLNHGYQTYRMALANPDWFCQLQTIEDTGVLTAEDIQAERDAGMSELKIRQEFYCEFTQSTENQIFNGNHITQAQERAAAIRQHLRNHPPTHAGAMDPWPVDRGAPFIMGIDVARYGDDRTVIAFRVGKDAASVPPIIMQNKDMVQVAEVASEHARRHNADAIFVDETGMGAGLVDILRRNHRLPVRGIHFSRNAVQDKTYHNIRTEMYARFAEWLDDDEVVLHPDQGLREEMASVEYGHDAHDRIKLEPKHEAKKRLGVSPDMSDAYAITFAGHVPRRDSFRAQRRGGPPRGVISW